MSRQLQQALLPLPLLLVTSFILLNTGAIIAQDDDPEVAAAEAAADAAETATDPNLVTYPENEEPNEVPGDNSIEPRKVSPARKQALQRRAGEQVGDNPRGRAVVLGMYLQEADSERAKVVEVGAATPAFDAGIRKGDEIISFDGFKANTYRQWIDGMRKLATDVPDGDTIPIELIRGEKRLNLRLRIPVAKAGVPPPVEDTTLNQTIVPGGQSALAVPGQQQPVPYGGGVGGDTLIGTVFGDDFDSGDTAGRAIAEIFRINVSQQTAPAARPASGDPAGVNVRARDRAIRAVQEAAGAGARIGIAGFRSDADGMLVMLDVGGLAPGNYLVGIDDPSMLTMGGNVPGTRPDEVPRNPRARTGSAGRETAPVIRQQPVVPRDGAEPARQQPAIEQQPSRPTGTDDVPQSRLQRPAPRSADIPRSVLAQVAESAADAPVTDTTTPGASPSETPANETRPVTTPATGGGQPLDTPATGQVDPLDATPTGVRRAGDPRRNAVANSGVGPAMRIGTLTVDQSGTGRLQQVVEGVRVRDVVGQAIVIYSQNGNPQTALPPNLNAGADPLAGSERQRAPAGGSRAATQPTAATSTATPEIQPGTSNAASGRPIATANDRNARNTIPVAGGVIRLLDEGLLNTNVPADVPQSPANSQGIPQSSAVPAGGEEPGVR